MDFLEFRCNTVLAFHAVFILSRLSFYRQLSYRVAQCCLTVRPKEVINIQRVTIIRPIGLWSHPIYCPFAVLLIVTVILREKLNRPK